MTPWLVIFAIAAVCGFAGWVFSPARPAAVRIPKRDPNAPCPVCGDTNGRLLAVAEKTNDAKSKVLLQRECQSCGARSYELPVVRDLTVEKAWPARADFRSSLTNVTPLRRKA